MEKIKTGIPGFDDLVEGGFNINSVNLVSGGPGCGKTIFSLQYLWNGLENFGENGIFISLEENIDDLRLDALKFGWDFKKYEEKGMFKFVYFHPYDAIDLPQLLEEEIKSVNARRVVIDSISVYGMTLESDFEVRKGLYELISHLKKLGCTTIITTEIVEDGRGKSIYSRFGVEEFLSDSIISLSFESMGGAFSRSLIIRKMRRTKNDDDIHPIEITDNGIAVHELS